MHALTSIIHACIHIMHSFIARMRPPHCRPVVDLEAPLPKPTSSRPMHEKHDMHSTHVIDNDEEEDQSKARGKRPRTASGRERDNEEKKKDEKEKEEEDEKEGEAERKEEEGEKEEEAKGIIPAGPTGQKNRVKQMFQDGIRAIYKIQKPDVDVEKVLAKYAGKEQAYYFSCCAAWGPPHAPKQYAPRTKRGDYGGPPATPGPKQESPLPKERPTPVPEPARPPRWLTDGKTWVPRPPPKPAVPPSPWWPPVPPAPILPKKMPQTAPPESKQGTAKDLGALEKAPPPQAMTYIMHEHDHACVHECGHAQQLCVKLCQAPEEEKPAKEEKEAMVATDEKETEEEKAAQNEKDEEPAAKDEEPAAKDETPKQTTGTEARIHDHA